MKIKLPQIFFKKSTKRGFTLIETFIAITILMIAVVGPLTVAQRSLSSARYARDRVTAFYLAQDTIEYIRSIRDDAFYRARERVAGTITWADTDFLDNILASCTGSWCNIDTSVYYVVSSNGNNGRSIFFPCGATEAGCGWISYYSKTGVYQEYPDSTSGQFRRSVYMQRSLTNPDELVIRVNVVWNSSLAGGLGEVEIQENLFDWQDF